MSVSAEWMPLDRTTFSEGPKKPEPGRATSISPGFFLPSRGCPHRKDTQVSSLEAKVHGVFCCEGCVDTMARTLIQLSQRAASDQATRDGDRISALLSGNNQTEALIVSRTQGQRFYMKPKVVHCKREKYDIYIGRPSKWGNPFEIGRDGTRDQVIQKYRDWIKTKPNLISSLRELDGKTLGCWCSPNPCHGDVLAELLS